MNQPATHDVAIVQLEIDPTLQARTRLDETTVERYADTLRQSIEDGTGWPFPPLVAVYDLLVDGHHRYAAAKRVGLSTVPVVVHQGEREDAIRLAVSANGNHGLHRNREDVQRAIRLAHETWPEESARSIARMVGCSHPTVSSVLSRYRGVDDESATPPAARSFEELDAIVQAEMDGFIKACNAFQTLRDKRLYRFTHKTFDAFCQDEFGFTEEFVLETLSMVAGVLAVKFTTATEAIRAHAFEIAIGDGAFIGDPTTDMTIIVRVSGGWFAFLSHGTEVMETQRPFVTLYEACEWIDHIRWADGQTHTPVVSEPIDLPNAALALVPRSDDPWDGVQLDLEALFSPSA